MRFKPTAAQRKALVLIKSGAKHVLIFGGSPKREDDAAGNGDHFPVPGLSGESAFDLPAKAEGCQEFGTA
jgi:hypothetical protein